MKRQLTVLLADDDKVQTLMLSHLLRERGFVVLAAYDATQAFILAMKNLPNAIVLDIQMPGGTGTGVLQRLKASSKTMQIPVIVLSGSVDELGAEAVMALGADEFLAKPVDVVHLFEALARVMELPPEPDAAP